MAITLYGIPNCDTVKKARTWLDQNGVSYTFHDFKKAGLNADIVHSWLKYVPWETLVNRKGTTWRGLPEERKAAIIDARSAVALMLETPSVIKRPVLVDDKSAHVGFSDALYQQHFAGS
ncbi:ArsC family reductase [Herbaspirillum sp. GCM10030257]|uniref:ArsC family reductase n=1 Tax=Herbaspirillum sp. GCM10030257 TaxID=3273393 RepID=UPI003612121E